MTPVAVTRLGLLLTTLALVAVHSVAAFSGWPLLPHSNKPANYHVSGIKLKGRVPDENYIPKKVLDHIQPMYQHGSYVAHSHHRGWPPGPDYPKPELPYAGNWPAWTDNPRPQRSYGMWVYRPRGRYYDQYPPYGYGYMRRPRQWGYYDDY